MSALVVEDRAGTVGSRFVLADVKQLVGKGLEVRGGRGLTTS